MFDFQKYEALVYKVQLYSNYHITENICSAISIVLEKDVRTESKDLFQGGWKIACMAPC